MARVRVEVPAEPNKTLAHPAAQQPAVAHPPHQGLTVKKLAIIILALVIVLFVGKLVTDNNKLEKQVKTNTNSQDATAIVDRLKQSIELPDGESPQLRTISDASKFTEQNPSLADIQNGDVLLFFSKSQKVVVYRPSTHKAVVVVTLSQPTANTPIQEQSN